MDIRREVACIRSKMEETKGIGKRDVKGNIKDCFIFDSWFASNKPTESAMDVGADMIGMFQTNKKVL